ncbi:hypothetical protein AXI59_01945 [Bacillus nakamurai]|uniref:Aspartate phosphatase n=1 Tax=Bacillus nakamurai TaxID=1793963 RepID=A0A150F5P0_9BACI|nr:hypothetical protein [Bacillus nakamurai]KXZ15284.1 hypothetical protein AXI58_03225 [Bacillus nakamurai]KXZ16670.1 hypothetical protein AXI59_01945 [Bacillus nakamurai]MED1226877.1 hypothetical protein [Bacillus nakamurai]
MSIKVTSACILFIVLLGFLGHYLVSKPSEMKEARRGQTASIEMAAHKLGDINTASKFQSV